jgi:hypothetical protein
LEIGQQSRPSHMHPRGDICRVGSHPDRPNQHHQGHTVIAPCTLRKSIRRVWAEQEVGPSTYSPLFEAGRGDNSRGGRRETNQCQSMTHWAGFLQSFQAKRHGAKIPGVYYNHSRRKGTSPRSPGYTTIIPDEKGHREDPRGILQFQTKRHSAKIPGVYYNSRRKGTAQRSSGYIRSPFSEMSTCWKDIIEKRKMLCIVIVYTERAV